MTSICPRVLQDSSMLPSSVTHSETDTFFLVIGWPHVWHFLNSSIKQLSFTMVFDWLKCSSVFLSNVSVNRNSVSCWKFSLWWSTGATLQKLSLNSAGGVDWDEVLRAPCAAIWDNRDRYQILKLVKLLCDQVMWIGFKIWFFFFFLL